MTQKTHFTTYKGFTIYTEKSTKSIPEAPIIYHRFFIEKFDFKSVFIFWFSIKDLFDLDIPNQNKPPLGDVFLLGVKKIKDEIDKNNINNNQVNHFDFNDGIFLPSKIIRQFPY